MKRLLIYYNFVIVSLITIAGFLGAKSFAQLITAVFFYPLVMYFTFIVFPQRKKAVVLPQVRPTEVVPHAKETAKTERGKVIPEGFDIDRRMFLKIISSAGISLFVLSLFTKKAQAAFFGSVPGPGTVFVKDTTGTRIDPAVKQPTDGYRISGIDDDSESSYYGFINKDGEWFIMRETSSSGDYRYVRGSSNFPTNWSNRTSLSYDYFHNVF